MTDTRRAHHPIPQLVYDEFMDPRKARAAYDRLRAEKLKARNHLLDGVCRAVAMRSHALEMFNHNLNRARKSLESANSANASEPQ